MDLIGFNLRVESAVEFAKKYSKALVLFSGKRPDVSRANEQEMQDSYSEARVMAEAAIELGLRNAVVLEEQSLHAGQNIKNSLDLLNGLELRRLLVVCSSYMGRRLDYYMKKELKERSLEGRLDTFIYDADVAQDAIRIPLTTVEQERKGQRILYEAKRLSQYRRKGDL